MCVCVSFSHRWNMTALAVDVRCGGNSRTVQEGAAGGLGPPGHLVWGRNAHARKHSGDNPATQQERTAHDASYHAGACGGLTGIHDARFQGGQGRRGRAGGVRERSWEACEQSCGGEGGDGDWGTGMTEGTSVLQVLPCPKGYRHNWKRCPYAHEGESERRRDPRVFNYSAIVCPATKKVRHAGRGAEWRDGAEGACVCFFCWFVVCLRCGGGG